MARKILLADDSVTAQNMGRRILTDAGYDVVTVNNGSAALKKIAELKPDLVILDVYMPGYGGLEVCQRLKENPDTARVPVLLTVGKLEPFRPDDAKRVRAESFIVKPFEASELLTALTKLEDRIVPQPELPKPGRFAKVIASLEPQASGGESFGDAETGWKNRIKLPVPGAKKEEPEPEAVPTAAKPVADLGRGEDFKPQDTKKEFERPIPAGLPADITPEEIAAITAAASAIGSKAPQPGNEQARILEQEKEQEKEKQAVASAATESVASIAAVPATQDAVAAPAEVSVAQAEPAPVQAPEPPAEQPPVVAASAETSAPVAEAAPSSVPENSVSEKPVDDEVDAALATLAPVLDTVSVAAPAVTTYAGVTVGTGATGPRWIAESIPLQSDEAMMILEREMEKAYAAMVAADSALATSSSNTAVAVVEPEPVIQSSREQVPAPASAEITEGASSREKEETLAAVAVAEAPAEPSFETPAAQTPSAESVPEPVSPPPADAVASVAVEAAPAVQEQAAYAVAAAGGSISSELPTEILPEVSSVAAPEVVENPVADESDKQREADLAAAWQHWKNIRETIVGEQFTSQLAEAASAELKDAPSEDADSEDASQEESAHESGVAIASIVDSVLADLKPKLVQEIAKKLENDKKKKKKK